MGVRFWADATTAFLARLAIMVASGAALAAFVAVIFAAAGFAFGIASGIAGRAAAVGHDLARLVL